MDHDEAVQADSVYRHYPLVHIVPDPLTLIALGLQLLQVFANIIVKLKDHLKRCKKNQCQDLQELLESIGPVVTFTAEEVENCKRLGITTTPQEWWLDRLTTELWQMEKLIDKCALTSGVVAKLRGADLSKNISAKLDTLKGFASQLPQMHGEMTNLRMTAEMHEKVVGARRMPEFGNQRNSEFVKPDGVRYGTRLYNSFRRMPSFEKYGIHDAEFVSDKTSGYDSRPNYWYRPTMMQEFLSDRSGYESWPNYSSARHTPSSGDDRNHDALLVCVDGVYFHKARAESIFLAQPIGTRSIAWFGRVPVMNPNYMKHIEHEYNY